MTDMRAQFEAWAQRENLSVERNPAYGKYGELAYVSFSTDICWCAFEAASAALGAEVERLREALSAAMGYMTNAAIDLETGAPKRTALGTINGGIKLAREAMENTDNG